ncbi:hypothetical protein [Paenibacillus endoradicis]|uniref:hypothetical protein n=1 Tax=Paenibacillus endoradicis TaxID=2972487 RepID=UPI002158DF43|nr:hypothetical protein [Paenibacillus endoradicis]MCR8656677.1 hypothetical protein [Paenibacillus endoradicis]
MKDTLNTFYVLIVGIISIFTKEIVTFIMLGFILLALNNILIVQKEISKKLDNQNINNTKD